ncbi:MAG: hypothetical protein ACYCVH_10555 [Ignavibacteriaceae bacterium]
MHKQINTTSLNIQNVIPREGFTKTFQKNKSRQELLGHSSLKNVMIYIRATNLRAGERSPLLV